MNTIYADTFEDMAEDALFEAMIDYANEAVEEGMLDSDIVENFICENGFTSI